MCSVSSPSPATQRVPLALNSPESSPHGGAGQSRARPSAEAQLTTDRLSLSPGVALANCSGQSPLPGPGQRVLVSPTGVCSDRGTTQGTLPAGPPAACFWLGSARQQHQRSSRSWEGGEERPGPSQPGHCRLAESLGRRSRILPGGPPCPELCRLPPCPRGLG